MNGMVNTSELSLHVVSYKKPKVLIGFNQKVSSQDVVGAFCIADVALPANRENLTHSRSISGTWKPRIAPGNRTANRKGCLWRCGLGMLEKANAVL